MALFSGLVGAVSAGVPLRALVEGFGWRAVMVGSAGITFLVAALTWVFVRDDPAEIGYAGHAPASVGPGLSRRPGIRAGFREIFRFRNTWLLVAAPSGVVGPVLAFSGLWGVPFLTTHYHLSTARAAALTSTLLVAWAVAGPLLGALSDRIGRRKPIYAAGCLVTFLGWTLILLVPGLSYPLLVGLLLLTGFASGCMIIGFAFAKESVPPAYAGTVSGVTNMGVMIGPMVLQPAIGWILDRNWRGGMLGGARIYDLTAYRKGFILILAWSLLAAILIFFTRETNCRQQE
jgi:MFS family permease